MNWQHVKQHIAADFRTLARCISYIENETDGYVNFLATLPSAITPIIGITGPPGAGKSTLVDALIAEFVAAQKKVAVLCIDPSSPFNLGALLGDRIRMSNWYNHEQVYIRSLATRGALGGLHPKIIEITEVLKAAAFDYIIVETVGVGQSEIEIAGLADATCVVLVPEAGDEIQTMKAGLMEIANLFIVNKADRPEADVFIKNLQQMLAPVYKHTNWEVPVLKTIASQKEGINQVVCSILEYLNKAFPNEKRNILKAQKVFQIIQIQKMKGFDLKNCITFIEENPHKNLYQTVTHIMSTENLPKVADTQPSCIKVEAGKTYAWCTCGLSEKITLCDGSHKKVAYEENGETVMPFKSLKFTAEKDAELWLCNCKQTKNPPYCDGSHNSLK